MKIERINVKRGKKLNLGNYESSNLEIGMEVLIEDGDDPHDTINGLYRILNQKIEAWERTESGATVNDQQSIVKTADTIHQPADVNYQPELDKPVSKQPASKQSTSKQPASKQSALKQPVSTQSASNNLICPKCQEVMVQKDGKDYFVCQKHWGYPDMIEKGEVRDKRF